MLQYHHSRGPKDHANLPRTQTVRERGVKQRTSLLHLDQPPVTKRVQSNLSVATTQDHGRAWSLWTGGLYIQVNYIRKTQGDRREQVVASTGDRYIQVVAKAGLTVLVIGAIT
jgi:hypothetical protein